MLKQPIYRNFNSSTYHIKNLILTPESAKLHYISNWDESLAVHTSSVFLSKHYLLLLLSSPNLIFFFFFSHSVIRSIGDSPAISMQYYHTSHTNELDFPCVFQHNFFSSSLFFFNLNTIHYPLKLLTIENFLFPFLSFFLLLLFFPYCFLITTIQDYINCN